MDLLANVGLPMIAVLLPPAWLALIPIVLIEAAVGVRTIQAPFRRTVLAAAVANFVSTMLGIPLVWFVLAVVQWHWIGMASRDTAPVLNAAWLPPYERDLGWMAPIAVLVLSLPMWLMSVVSEWFVVKRFFPSVARRDLWRWMWRGNTVSYAFLVVLTLCLPLLGPAAGLLYRAMEPVSDCLMEITIDVLQAMD
jgi:hypothetical protein